MTENRNSIVDKNMIEVISPAIALFVMLIPLLNILAGAIVLGVPGGIIGLIITVAECAIAANYLFKSGNQQN